MRLQFCGIFCAQNNDSLTSQTTWTSAINSKKQETPSCRLVQPQPNLPRVSRDSALCYGPLQLPLQALVALQHVELWAESSSILMCRIHQDYRIYISGIWANDKYLCVFHDLQKTSPVPFPQLLQRSVVIILLFSISQPRLRKQHLSSHRAVTAVAKMRIHFKSCISGGIVPSRKPVRW